MSLGPYNKVIFLWILQICCAAILKDSWQTCLNLLAILFDKHFSRRLLSLITQELGELWTISILLKVKIFFIEVEIKFWLKLRFLLHFNFLWIVCLELELLDDMLTFDSNLIGILLRLEYLICKL